jgi:hypothetical protein
VGPPVPGTRTPPNFNGSVPVPDLHTHREKTTSSALPPPPSRSHSAAAAAAAAAAIAPSSVILKKRNNPRTNFFQTRPGECSSRSIVVVEGEKKKQNPDTTVAERFKLYFESRKVAD